MVTDLRSRKRRSSTGRAAHSVSSIRFCHGLNLQRRPDKSDGWNGERTTTDRSPARTRPHASGPTPAMYGGRSRPTVARRRNGAPAGRDDVRTLPSDSPVGTARRPDTASRTAVRGRLARRGDRTADRVENGTEGSSMTRRPATTRLVLRAGALADRRATTGDRRRRTFAAGEASTMTTRATAVSHGGFASADWTGSNSPVRTLRPLLDAGRRVVRDRSVARDEPPSGTRGSSG